MYVYVHKQIFNCIDPHFMQNKATISICKIYSWKCSKIYLAYLVWFAISRVVIDHIFFRATIIHDLISEAHKNMSHDHSQLGEGRVQTNFFGYALNI